MADPDFSRWWSRHDVRRRVGGVKRFLHPVVGELTLNYDRLVPPDDPDQRLSLYTAEPTPPSAEALRLLGDRVASPRERVQQQPITPGEIGTEQIDTEA